VTPFEQACVQRLKQLTKTARMWGSPEELECVALHLTHVLYAHREKEWSLEKTFATWQALGAPFAGDAEEHAAMRSKMWGADEELARSQVVQGFVVVWAGLERDPEKEAVVGPWLEQLLDAPRLAGTPDRLNMTLFALMGFVARDPSRYVQALNLERHRIGGHELRALPVVAPPGPSEAGLTYTRNFTSWPKVIEGIGAMLARLEEEPPASP
jgi:hypothetical protein